MNNIQKIEELLSEIKKSSPEKVGKLLKKICKKVGV